MTLKMLKILQDLDNEFVVAVELCQQYFMKIIEEVTSLWLLEFYCENFIACGFKSEHNKICKK